MINNEKLYDAIVIGSGVCGAITAWKLGDAGFKVLLLEAGEDEKDRAVLLERYFSATNKTPGSPYRTSKSEKYAKSPDDIKKDYIQKGPNLFKSTYQRRVGGSTWHFLGNMPRFLPNDFRLREMYEKGEDWPLTYDDLENDYCTAEKELGVAGDHEQWNGLFGAKRSVPFPMQKIWESYSDKVVSEQVKDLVIDNQPIRLMNTPQARNSEPYDDRPACAGNSICVPICPIGAKYDGTVHVKKALKVGVELLDKTVVSKLIPDGNNKLITQVVAKRWDETTAIFKGKLIVIAAHAIESARILLNSELAKDSGQVGKNLMDHLQGYVWGFTKKPIYPFRGPPTTSGIDCFRDGKFRKEYASFRMSLGNDGWGRAGSPDGYLTSLVEKEGLFGQRLKQRVEHDFTRMFRISYSTEVLPSDENYVDLADEVDHLGIRKTRLAFKLTDYNLKAFEKAEQIIRTIFTHMEMQQIQASEQSDYSGAGHIIGTCRMGDDPKKSVADSYGQCFQHPNLFIVGSAVFPTSGTANPTLTAAALTFRSIRKIKEILPTLG